MGLITNYLITTKNLDDFFTAIIQAQAPEKFTHKFLQHLGFTSTNDRLYIGLLKGLGLLDENSVPTEIYYKFLDETQSKIIMADLIRNAYEDLFAINKNAQEYSFEEIKNKFRSLTQGQKSDTVLTNMANTFLALCEWADFESEGEEFIKEEENAEDAHYFGVKKENEGPIDTSLHYNIQIHLPESRDPAVYDSIFQSLKKHLL